MSKAQEDRAREKFADKMREKSAKAKAALVAKRASKSVGEAHVSKDGAK
jgi:hypothetical protein